MKSRKEPRRLRQTQYRDTEKLRGLSLRTRAICIVAAIITVLCARLIIVAKKETAARELGYRVQSYRQEEIAAHRMNEKLKTRVAELTRASRLKQCLKEYGIVLEVPSLEQVVQLKLPELQGNSTYAKASHDRKNNNETITHISQR